MASAATRDSGVRCPACEEQLVVRVPSKRVPHFAHPAGKKCADQVASRRAEAKERRAHLKAAAAARAIEQAGQDALFDVTELQPSDAPAEAPTA